MYFVTIGHTNVLEHPVIALYKSGLLRPYSHHLSFMRFPSAVSRSDILSGLTFISTILKQSPYLIASSIDQSKKLIAQRLGD
jgi:hypothetical protein